MSGFQKQEDLDDIYSDLSEKEEDNHMEQKPPPKQTMTFPKPTVKMPDFLGGKDFIPPPPPPSNRPFPRKEQAPRGQVDFNKHKFTQPKEWRNVIYVKNIPKTYNRQETLTTFFRTYGNIKGIKTNQATNSAVIRFERQQDSFRFLQTKPLMFNRSYIMYDSNENYVVPPEKVQEREKQENVSVVKDVEKEVFLMKDNSESILADIYRGLLFLNRNRAKLSQQKCEQIDREMSKVRKIKESQNNNDHFLGQMLQNLQNDYSWVLSYKIKTKEMIQKKKIITQFNKFGPIGTVTIKATQDTDDTEMKTATIKIKFLGVRSSWEMYLEFNDQLVLQVEGRKLQQIFQSWFVKQKPTSHEQNQPAQPVKQEQAKQEEDEKEENSGSKKTENGAPAASPEEGQ